MEIDKSTWNYIEFDKIGNFFSGYTPKSNEISENDSVPYFKVAEMNIPGNERWLHCTSLFVDDSHKVFPPNSIVFPKNGAAVSTNKKRILSVYSVVDLNTAGVTLHERCLPLYAYYWILTKDFNEFIRRGAVPTLNLKALKKEIFPLPSLEIQKNIVSELDMLQEVIDGYKAQIFDLDALAQSIFLDTFGDPISNPKGWEVKSFSTLFSLKSGDGLSAKNFIIGSFPVYGGNGIAGYHNDYNKNVDYIIIGRVGAKCGNVRHIKGKFWLTDNAFELTQKKELFNPDFLTNLLISLNLGSKAKVMAQPVISNVALKEIVVYIPPVYLQQQFASQVDAIEKQKELLHQQLADAEMLMAERMQYYFS